MQQYNKVLQQLEHKHAPILLEKHGLICKQLPFGDDECPPLYLAKPHWTNRFDDNRDSTIGIFCAIWLAPTQLKKNRFKYNIHSKSLKKLPGYKAEPRKFASEFRNLVETSVSQWPGISLKYGPSTLLQGSETFESDSFADKVEERILGFVDIYQPIDDLLELSLI